MATVELGLVRDQNGNTLGRFPIDADVAMRVEDVSARVSDSAGLVIVTLTLSECTSDDPTNHQGDTCPIHEAN